MRPLIAGLAAAAAAGVVLLTFRRAAPTLSTGGAAVLPPPTPNPHAWADETKAWRRRHWREFWGDVPGVELTTGWRKPPPPTSAAIDAAMQQAVEDLNMTPLDKKPTPAPRRPDDGFRDGDTERESRIIGSTAHWVKPPAPSAEDLARAEDAAMADFDMEPAAIVVRGGDKYPRQYDPIISETARKNHLSPEVLKAVLITESSLRANAIGPPNYTGERAQGIAQFMPATWREWGAGGDPLNPADAIPAAGRYLRWLLNRRGVDGDWYNALLAYNQGIGHFWNGKRFPAAEQYADKILRIAGQK